MSELGSKEKKGAKQSPSLKARALRLLSLREYSRKGMAAKLAESEQRWVKLAKTDAKESSNADQDSLPVKSTVIEIDAILDDFEVIVLQRPWSVVVVTDMASARSKMSSKERAWIPVNPPLFSKHLKRLNISGLMSCGLESLVHLPRIKKRKLSTIASWPLRALVLRS